MDALQALKIEAGLAQPMRAEFSEEVFQFFKAGQDVESQVAFPGREAGAEHVAFAAGGVAVMVCAVADDGGAPHLGLFAGNFPEDFIQGLGVLALGGILKRIKELADAGLGWLGLVLVFSHW